MQIEKASVANGKGIRTVLWVSGCSLHCKGCQNPETWDFFAGKHFDMEAEKELFDYISKPYIQGLTISGGHPLEKRNIKSILTLITRMKARFPEKDIWLYTGLNLTDNDFLSPFGNGKYGIQKHTVLNLCDVVVDGEYREELRDTTLAFRGSSNQRLIDVKQTIENQKIVLFKV